MNTTPPSPAHTPGPWARTETPEGHYRSYSDVSDYPDVADVFYRDTDAEWEANANLIAAAPELLEMLKRIEQWATEDDTERFGTVSQGTWDMRKLIAKAEGRA